jgi:hypothetical protein
MDSTQVRESDGLMFGAVQQMSSQIFSLTLDFGTFIGGSGFETTYGMTLDKTGGIYITGETNSVDFPVVNAYQPTLKGGYDRYLSKLACDGQRYAFSTYFGGSGEEDWRIFYSGWGGNSRHIFPSDTYRLSASASRVYTIAQTNSTDFPITSGVVQTVRSSDSISAILSFEFNGTLSASSFLGGPGIFAAEALCTDKSGNVIITGAVLHDRLWFVTPESIQPTLLNTGYPKLLGAAIVKLSPDLASVRFGSYYFAVNGMNRSYAMRHDHYPNWYQYSEAGIEYSGSPRGIGLIPLTDSDENIILTGVARFGDVPLVSNFGDSTRNGSIFSTKITLDGRNIIYSTLVGNADNSTMLESARIDGNDNLHIGGMTTSIKWPLMNAFQTNIGGRLRPCYAVLSTAGQLALSSYGYKSAGYAGFALALDACSNALLFGAAEQSESIPLLRPLYSDPWQRCGNPYLVYMDSENKQPAAITWLHDANVKLTYHVVTDPRNNIYALQTALAVTGQYDSACIEYTAKKAIQPLFRGGQDLFLSRYRIEGMCNALACSIILPDSIRVASRRGFAEPDSFLVTVEVENPQGRQMYRAVYLELALPNGLALDGTDQNLLAQPTPDILVPGAKLSYAWRVHIKSGYALRHATIRVRVHYAEPEAAGDCPPGISICEASLPIRLYDEREPDLRCLLEGPDALSIEQLSSMPVRYQATFTNHDADSVLIDLFRLRAGESCSIVGGEIRPGVRLAPGASHVIPIDITISRLRFGRVITVEAEACDGWGLDISRCALLTRIPDMFELPCTASGPVRINWNVASGVSSPPVPRYTLQLENPLDTIRTNVRAWLDLSSAPHLSPAPGDSVTRDPFTIGPAARVSPSWRMLISNPPASDTKDTLYFMYESDGIIQRCFLVVDIVIIDESVVCSLTGPDSLTVAQLENREKTQIDYTLSNVGTVPVTVTRIDLAISPTSGVLPLDPLSQPGGTIAPSGDINRQWRLRPLALRNARTAHFDVTAYGSDDSVLSVCTHDMHIPGIDGLLCDITAPDSVRFIRDELRYEPDPVPVTLDLRNILDTEETQIEAEIDLANAPRFELATGETAIKTLASIDSNSSAQLQWLLRPLADINTEAQDITIRYRSLEQGVWKECRTAIVIAAWPRESTVRCAVSGHDSLHADAAYERLIPEPFEISYTATNTGTVALHNCAATIILPPEFELASDSATLSFGELRPGDSNTRWWTLRTTSALSGYGAYPVNFSWRSDEQGSVTGCDHTVHIVSEASSGILFTPLHLHFEAERNDPLPAAQYIQLWTGGGLSMPWTAQGGQWWLNADPATGDHAARIAVQPNSTDLPIGLHSTALTIAGQAPNLPKDVAVTYEIRGVLDTERRAAARLYGMGPVWPQPVSLNGEARIGLSAHPGEYVRIVLYDALGREVALLREGVMPESDGVLRIVPSALRLQPGMYFIRMIAAGGVETPGRASVRAVVVR